MLRTRIFLNFVPVVILLLAVGAYAIVLFSRLANRVDTTVSGNYRSILLAQTLRLDLTEMERAAWFSFAGTSSPTPALMHLQANFEKNLTQLTNNAPLPRQPELNAKLAAHYAAFKRVAATLDVGENAKKRQAIFQMEITPTILAMDNTLQRIRDLNHEAILATQESVQRITQEITRPMIIGMGVALILSIYVFFRLGRSILAPIQSLTRATREVTEGRWNHPVPVFSRDELGELAVSFNTMAARLQEYRRNTSDEIVRLHRTMETTLASFPDPIFVLNQAGRIELKNPAATEFAAALGLGEKLPDRLQSLAETVLAKGESYLPHSFDAVASYRIGGAEKFFLPRILAMPDLQGAIFGVAVVLYDVTRFRLLDAAKSNLIATVSHELKSPLTGLRLVLHLLLEKAIGALNPKQDELLQRARDDAERLLRILNDLLDLARLEEGNAELRKEPVAPAELIEGVIKDMADRFAGQGLQVVCRVDPNLPAVLVDRQRISHIFANLVNNAIKHSPPGGKVVFRATSGEDDSVRFSLTDQGPGIPEEYQVRIFDRFFRVPGQEKGGAGLGLSIAREIALAHGGRVGVRSSPGKGSMFFVVLPIAAGAT